MQKIRYSIIIPVYNDEDNIFQLYKNIKSIMDVTGADYEFLFINDGSRDQTEECLITIKGMDNRVKSLNFLRHLGQQIAIAEGVNYAQGEAIIIINTKFLESCELISEMIYKWLEGYTVIYANQSNYQGKTFEKAHALPPLNRSFQNIENYDYCLIDQTVVEKIKQNFENNRFVFKLKSWLGSMRKAIEFGNQEPYTDEIALINRS